MGSLSLSVPGCLLLIFCGAVNAFMVENDTTALMYLERFGYIDHEDMDPYMEMKEAQPMLMAFQKMCGIHQTGELDTKTMEMMNTPRCGNKDMIRVPTNETDGSGNRLKRYMINESKYKWKSREVTYRMGMFSHEMQKHVTKENVLDAIHKAFEMWSEVTNLDFIHSPDSKKVDIELSFTTRFHIQDGFPFDGPGKVLAHAFPPGPAIGGDVHFEDEEDWRVHSPKGTDVLFVAVHEIGHALGLSHSSTKGAIMAAFYGGYKPHLKLHPDDIEGIQAIYGKREVPSQRMPPPPPSTTTTTTERLTTARRVTTAPYTSPPTTKRLTTTSYTPPRPTTTTQRYIPAPNSPWSKWENERLKFPKVQIPGGRPDLCADSKIDAIMTLNDGNIYIFKGAYTFRIGPNGEGILPGWPNHIGYVFNGLETNIDAAATRENGKTYFFKGNKYWRFTGTVMDTGYPKLIAQHFLGIPDDIDAAFVWLGNFYFTKGDKFWRFNPKSKPHVEKIYPLSTDRWNIPYGIDAAFRAPNQEIYFFKGSDYYRLDQQKFRIIEAEPPYPRRTSVMWLGCTAFKPEARNIRDYSINDDDDDIEVEEIPQNDDKRVTRFYQFWN